LPEREVETYAIEEEPKLPVKRPAAPDFFLVCFFLAGMTLTSPEVQKHPIKPGHFLSPDE